MFIWCKRHANRISAEVCIRNQKLGCPGCRHAAAERRDGMEIQLNRLSLENFKGINRFALDAAGLDVSIHGANGSGKTTIADAFTYLLFGKDSEGKADFGIKTIGTGGPKSNIEHAVEGSLSIDGKNATLKKAYKEKWVRKRGSSSPELSGHTTDLEIDGVPVKKKEWDARIDELIQEDTFRLLTSPHHFNSLHWQKRRELLLQVCGDVSDEEVIASNKKLAGLAQVLGDHSIDEQRKIITRRRQAINKELTEIPARIDELNKSLADVPDIDTKAATARIAELGHEIAALENDAEAVGLSKKKIQLEAEYLQLQQAQKTKWYESLAPLREAITELREKLDKLSSAATRLESDIRDKGYDIGLKETRMAALRSAWKEESEKAADIKDTCPTCGQSLPADQVEEAQRKFNLAQAEALEKISAEGKRLKAETDELKKQVEEQRTKLEAGKPEREDLERQLEQAKNELVVAEQKELTPTDEMARIQAEINALRDEVASKARPDTSALEQERAALQRDIAAVDAGKRSAARVEELKADEKRLAAEYEDLERQLSLMDEFTKTKVGMVEDRVAGKFELVRFRLFEEQINGGIAETCVTTMDNVPYPDLSNSERIKAGLDIIRALQKHYGVRAPIFVDNAESVTEVPEMECQVVRLVVDETAPELDVRHQQTQEERKVQHG